MGAQLLFVLFFWFAGNFQPGQRIVDAHLHQLVPGAAGLPSDLFKPGQGGIGQAHRYHRGFAYRRFAAGNNKFIFLHDTIPPFKILVVIMGHCVVLFIYYIFVLQAAKGRISMEKRAFTCCFTGHRELPIEKEGEIWQKTYIRVQQLLEQGVKYFGVGGAIGFDTLAAEGMLQVKTLNPQVKIILVLPFKGYQKYWLPGQQERAAKIERQVDKIVYCCDRPSRAAFLIRDRHLVDESAYCIGYCTRSTGGTAYTLRYAEKQGLKVWNIGKELKEPKEDSEKLWISRSLI